MKKLLFIASLLFPLGIIAQPSVQEQTIGFLTYNEGRVLSLAEKFSEEQFNWRPAEGVRSVGEVVMHIASANYFFMSSAGIAIPEGINPQELEKEVKGKANILDAVTSSYVTLKEGINSISNKHLGDAVTLPWPGDHNKLTIILLSLDHTSEHLGQLIAYARMNGITPPWSEDDE